VLIEQIITREKELNDIVYELFELTAEERVLIERETKYPYEEESRRYTDISPSLFPPWKHPEL
jgi:hypothetical protein